MSHATQSFVRASVGILVVAVLVLALAGCGGGQTTPTIIEPPPPPPPPETGSITFINVSNALLEYTHVHIESAFGSPPAYSQNFPLGNLQHNNSITISDIPAGNYSITPYCRLFNTTMQAWVAFSGFHTVTTGQMDNFWL